MKKQLLTSLVTAAVLSTAALSASAQNIAVVNGKAVPKARAEALKQQIEQSGRPVTPELEGQIKEEVIAREIFMQEANKRSLANSEAYKQQMELARQTILIRALFEDFQKKNPVTDAEAKAEYDKAVAANSGKEYKARDRKSTRLNSSHLVISHAVFCLHKNAAVTVPDTCDR